MPSPLSPILVARSLAKFPDPARCIQKHYPKPFQHKAMHASACVAFYDPTATASQRLYQNRTSGVQQSEQQHRNMYLYIFSLCSSEVCSPEGFKAAKAFEGRVCREP